MRTYINFKKQSIFVSEDEISFLLGVDHFEKEFDYFFMGSWDALNFHYQRILRMQLSFTHTPIYKINEAVYEDTWYKELENHIQDHMPDNFYGSFTSMYEQDQEIDKDYSIIE